MQECARKHARTRVAIALGTACRWLSVSPIHGLDRDDAVAGLVEIDLVGRN